MDDLAYDLANLDAGFRFAGDENRWGGRLAAACRRIYGMQTIIGILENGVPPDYGSGAEQIVAAIHNNAASLQPDQTRRAQAVLQALSSRFDSSSSR